jgi:hypothetical protein
MFSESVSGLPYDIHCECHITRALHYKTVKLHYTYVLNTNERPIHQESINVPRI